MQSVETDPQQAATLVAQLGGQLKPDTPVYMLNASYFPLQFDQWHLIEALERSCFATESKPITENGKTRRRALAAKPTGSAMPQSPLVC
jgi:hypothetical protein